MTFEKLVIKPKGNTRFIFVRHGVTDANKGKPYVDEPKLDKEGHLQASKLAERFAKSGVKIDVLYSSTLIRAYQTALYTSKTFTLPIIKSKALVEVGDGYVQWENQMNDLPEESRYVSKEHLRLLKEEFKLIQKQIEKIEKENTGKTVVIFTHGGVIRLLRCYYNNQIDGVTKRNLKDTPWSENTAITILDKGANDKKYKLILENDYKHLKVLSKSRSFDIK